MAIKQKTLHTAFETKARERASKALRNARQRCTNHKNPDYPSYGGCGIEVRFTNLAELIAAIGLPKPDQSLDRINPHGHYEVGNVRWACVAVQAANKKLSPTNYHLSDAALITKATDAVAQQLDRKHVAIAWVTMLRAYARGYLTTDEAASLAERIRYPGVLEANFDLNTVFDYANETPGFIHLPALTLPGARVRLRSAPNNSSGKEGYLLPRQRLVGLEKLGPSWNVPPSVWKRALDVVNGGMGLLLLGKATPDLLLGGWIEGACLALASALPAATRQSASFFPMVKAIHVLDGFGSPFKWDEVAHPILDDDVVIIPDFVLDCGPWGDLGSSLWTVCRLLEYRAEHGRKTIIGAPSLASIPASVQNLVLGGFEHMWMPKRTPLDKSPLQYCAEHWPIDEGQVTLAMLAEEHSTSALVTAYD